MMSADITASPSANMTAPGDSSKVIQYGRPPSVVVERLDHAERVARETQPGGRAHQRERERFDEQLRENPPAARAERAAHRNLAQARHRARVDENGEIDRDDDGQRTRKQLTGAHRPQHGRILDDLRVGQ